MGLICLICSLSLSFSFVFFFFTTSGYDSNFIYKNACVCFMCVCNDFQHCFGIKFYIWMYILYIYSNIYVCIVIDLVGINLNRSSILYVLLVRLIGGLQFKNWLMSWFALNISQYMNYMWLCVCVCVIKTCVFGKYRVVYCSSLPRLLKLYILYMRRVHNIKNRLC